MFYLTREASYVGSKWHNVESSFSTKTALITGIVKMFNECLDEEDYRDAIAMDATASRRNIRVGKSIRKDWIDGRNNMSKATSEEVVSAMTAAKARCEAVDNDYSDIVIDEDAEYERELEIMCEFQSRRSAIKELNAIYGR